MDQELKTYLDGKFAAVDGKFAAIDGKFADIDQKFVDLENRLIEKMRDMQTELLRGFFGQRYRQHPLTPSVP